MTNIIIDPVKVKTAGEDIEKLSVKYEEVIKKIYSKLNSMESEGIWVGTSDKSSVKTYLNRINACKNNYLNFGNDIKNFSKKIINYSDNVDAITKESL